jgi:ferric iron reductase protein FhuF
LAEKKQDDRHYQLYEQLSFVKGSTHLNLLHTLIPILYYNNASMDKPMHSKVVAMIFLANQTYIYIYIIPADLAILVAR